MLRCEDNSIYTGMTNDLKRRLLEHFSKQDKCARYTVIHNITKLEIAWETESRSLATKLEYHIKKLQKKDKEELIHNSNMLNSLLESKVDCSEYRIVKK